MRTILLTLLLSLPFWLACQSEQPSNTSQAPATEPATQPAPPPPNIDLPPGATGALGDSAMFPYVFQGEGRSNILQAYSMSFRLEYQDPLIPVVNTAVPWMDPQAYSEQFGNFITYVRNGRRVSLTEPYIQVQYFSKNQPNCGTVDSVFMWLDQQFIEQRDAEVIQAKHEVQTASRLPALCKEYRMGELEKLAGKQLAYAYIDYDDDYIVGMALTTTAESDYEMSRELFYEMVKSFAFF